MFCLPQAQPSGDDLQVRTADPTKVTYPTLVLLRTFRFFRAVDRSYALFSGLWLGVMGCWEAGLAEADARRVGSGKVDLSFGLDSVAG